MFGIGGKKVVLDKDLYEKVAKYATQAGYASVQDFVVHMLESHVRHLEDAKDEDEVRKRLEGLGYID